MPLSITRFETARVLDGRARGVARLYPKDTGCPHEKGIDLILTSKYVDKSGNDTPFARVKLLDVRRLTIGEMKRNKALLSINGFASGPEWEQHFAVMYGGKHHDDDPIFHLQFKIEETYPVENEA